MNGKKKLHYIVQKEILPENCCNYCCFCYYRGDDFCDHVEDYVEIRGLCDMFERKPQTSKGEKSK